jgi:hypothetical protein
MPLFQYPDPSTPFWGASDMMQHVNLRDERGFRRMDTDETYRAIIEAKMLLDYPNAPQTSISRGPVLTGIQHGYVEDVDLQKAQQEAIEAKQRLEDELAELRIVKQKYLEGVFDKLPQHERDYVLANNEGHPLVDENGKPVARITPQPEPKK